MLTIRSPSRPASNFLDTLNKAHSSVKFTMETECKGMLPFLGIQLLNPSPQIETKVNVKSTTLGLLLHYQSHVGNRYKKGLLRTMLDRAHRLSSSWTFFSDECDRLRTVFSRLKYPKHSLLRRGSSVRYINPLCQVDRRRGRVEWIDQAENLCQMYVDFSYILVVFSYIDGFLDFG